MAAGFATRFSYSVAATLQVGERRIPLSTEGYSTSTLVLMERALRQSVAMAVDDIARQTLEALAANKVPSAAQRLRELEALRADRLITEEEYQERRRVLLIEL